MQERFLTTQDGDKPSIRKGTLNTFGEGMRSCIGQKFAKMEIKITLIRLLQAYTFQLAPGQETLALTTQSFPSLLKPDKGVHISVHSRS